MTRHRGHSLVEMLVVMSAASVILTTSAVLIHRTMRLASQTRAFHAEEATAWRLSAALRHDAAGASSIDLSMDDRELSLTLHSDAGEPIRYQFNAAQVLRSQRLDDDREARELFELPSVADWRAESADEAVTIRIDASASPLPTQSLAPVHLSLLVHAAGGSSL